ncbi:MAG: hypothetical protein HZR80_10085 [Candidatus Heimdallarchaeota archaeon]
MKEKIAYSYVLEHDTGFAPNPFFEYLTLAGCKPLLWGKKGIRKEVTKELVKNRDVWIFANGGCNLLLENYEYKNGKLKELPSNCDSYHRLVYAFKVKEVLTFEEYYKKPCFSDKRRKFASSHLGTFGDNNLHSHKICDKDHSKHYIEDPIVEFSNGKLIEKSCQITLVINVDNVLISGKNQFYYFGCFAPKILGNLDEYFKKGIRNRTIRDERIINEIVRRIEEISDPGIHGFPSFHTSKDYRMFANNSNYIREIYNECFDSQTKMIIKDWIIKMQDIRKIKNHTIKLAI